MEIVFFGVVETRNGDEKRKKVLSENRLKFMDEDYQNFGYNYWDNPNIPVGGQGYKYDGRFRVVAENMVKHYGLCAGGRVLDVGCSKGFLLKEFQDLGMDVWGCDVSKYAVENAYPSVRERIVLKPVHYLVFENKSFDLVICKDTLPHLTTYTLRSSILNMMRMGKKLFFEIECGETEQELVWMKEWDITHMICRTPEWWRRYLSQIGYSGDVHFKILIPEKGVEYDRK